MKKFGSELSLGAGGRVFPFVLVGLLVLFALVYAVNEAQAQTPADDQYGSPTAVGAVEGAELGSDTGVVSSFGTGSAGEVEDDNGASSSSAGSDTGDAVGGATGDLSGDPEGVLASVLPSTGGSSVFLIGLTALALVGTGIIVLRNRFARN